MLIKGDIMDQRVLFICKKRIDGYGQSFGLLNSANFVLNYLQSIGIQGKFVVVTDANGIDKEVHDYNPTIVIIEAIWVTAAKLKELLTIKKYAKIKWVVRVHSKIPCLANEGIAFSWLIEYKKLQCEFKNLEISFNSKDTVRDIKKTIGIRKLYLPNIYCPVDYDIPRTVITNKGYIDIGCFGAIRPMKNHLNQAIASINYGNETNTKIRFHINSDRLEQNGDNVYKNLVALFAGSIQHELIEHEWMSHEKFVKLVSTMDLGLQVSMSETFNIVAADFIWNNVPIIGSKEIDWMPSIFKANPNSSYDITEKIKLIMGTRDSKLYRLNNLALLFYNFKAKNIWEDFVIG